MLNPVALSIIRNVFEDPRERAQAVGVWGGVVGLSIALGPLLGGALVDSVGWRAIFVVNVPLGMLALVLTARFVPESRAPRARRLDPLGQALVIVALASLTYAIIEGPQPRLDLGRDRRSVRGRARRRRDADRLRGATPRAADRDPLLPQRAILAGASAIAVCAFAALGGFLFLNTLYLQDVRGLSPFHAGLYLLPMAAMTFVFAPVSGRLVGRHAVAAVTGRSRDRPDGGQRDADADRARDLGRLPVRRLSRVRPRLRSGQSSDHQHGGVGHAGPQAGVAAAVASTSRQVGMTLGVAIVGAVAGTSLSGAIGPRFAAASHAGWWIIAGGPGGALDRRADDDAVGQRDGHADGGALPRGASRQHLAARRARHRDPEDDEGDTGRLGRAGYLAKHDHADDNSYRREQRDHQRVGGAG